MHGKSEVRLRKTRKQSFLDHGCGAADTLFRRLTYIDKGSAPAVFILRQQSGGSDADRHVEIVSASVHHRDLSAAVIMGSDMARVSQAGFLRDGQSVEFGAQHDDRAGAILENTDDARAAKPGRNVISELPQLLGDFGSSLLFVIGKLGISVQVDIERLDLRID